MISHKLLLFILLFTTVVSANEGPVGAKAVVSTRSILSGNIVKLHIRATGKMATFKTVDTIDGVKVLSQDERITHRHVYNNGVLKKECTIFTLTFAPQKDMTIPSYEVKIDGRLYKTEPIKLKMKDTSTKNTQKSNIFSLKLDANKKTVSVGEAFLVTVTLSLQHHFSIAKKLQYYRPKFEGFFVEQMGKGKSYDEDNFQVTQLKYILTPHTEGNYTLGPAYAKIGLQDRNKEGKKNVDMSRKIFERASNTLALKVLPQPEQSDLVGTFHIKSKIDSRKVEAGKPVKLTLKIKGEGDLTHFEFPDYTLEGVTVYGEEAKVDIKEVNGTIFSAYSRSFIFVSEEDFSIPGQSFTVYDPKKDALKTLDIDTIDIEINSSKKQTSTQKSVHRDKKSENLNFKEKIASIPKRWWIFLLSFVIGALFLYLLPLLSKLKAKSYKESEALNLLLPHSSKDPEVEAMVRQLYTRVNGDKSVKIDKQKLKALIARYTRQ